MPVGRPVRILTRPLLELLADTPSETGRQRRSACRRGTETGSSKVDHLPRSGSSVGPLGRRLRRLAECAAWRWSVSADRILVLRCLVAGGTAAGSSHRHVLWLNEECPDSAPWSPPDARLRRGVCPNVWQGAVSLRRRRAAADNQVRGGQCPWAVLPKGPADHETSTPCRRQLHSSSTCPDEFELSRRRRARHSVITISASAKSNESATAIGPSRLHRATK